MYLEHIARGRWILSLSDRELSDITTIAMGFHKGNRSNTLSHIITGGIGVYNSLLKEGYAKDSQFEQSLKTLVEELPEQTDGFTNKDIAAKDSIDLPEQES